ncbi:MAG TPA: GNAT family N-acetyltransferase [Burkholderiaceae bacterium]|nr:GNAT family N-acetyltransferase [Burkholderiaceae bacterium]
MTDDVGDDRRFTQAGTLRDGTPVTIRVMHPDDRERIVTAFSKLDASTIYTRFFSYRKEIPAKTLDRIADIDFDHLAGLVATLGEGDDETVIAAATYVVTRGSEGAKTAEVAFTVEEDYQGQGLATRLFAALTGLARRHGIVHFEADVLSGNTAMLTVFQRCGLPMRRHSEGGVVHVTMDLTPAGS